MPTNLFSNDKKIRNVPILPERKVQNDFTIRFNNKWYQLTKEQPATIRPKEKVLLEERLDGSLWIRLRGKYLNYQILLAKPQKQSNQPWIIAASQKEGNPYNPSKDHPSWRKYPVILPSLTEEKVATP